MALSIESIRAAHTTLPRKEVEVSDLGGSVWARSLTLREVSDIQELQRTKKDKPTEINRKVVELGACNEDGTPLFVGQDKAIIDGLPWGAVDAISTAVLELSGLAKAAEGDGDDPKNR